MMHSEGTGPTWPIRPSPAGVCGGCEARPLEFRTYCLVCDRSGADHLIRPGSLVSEPVRKSRKVGRGVAAKAGAGIKGGIG